MAIAVPLSVIFFFIIHKSLARGQPCSRGSFRNPNGTCQLCAPGTFSDSVNAESCKPCRAGRFLKVSGAQTENACRSCPAGTSSAEGAAECTPCPPGSNSQRASQCRQCPPGTEVGFTFAFSSPECMPCFGGYSSLPSQLRCTRCPLGSAAPSGAISMEQCVRCPPGSAPSPPGGCIPCGEGFFSTDGLFCRFCPTGTRSIGTGNTRCEACPPGFVGNGESFGFGPACVPCSNGTTTFGTVSVLCRREEDPCPNTYLENSAGDCVWCPIDFFYDRDLESCEPCPDGFGSSGGLSLQCLPCFEIVNADITQSYCSITVIDRVAPTDENGDCPPGTHVSEQDGRSCVTCESGTFSDATNSVAVFNPKLGTVGCKPCPSGSVQPRSGSSNCEPCPPGTEPDDFFQKCVVPQNNCELGSSLVEQFPGFSACQSDNCDQIVGFEEFEGRECGSCGVGQFAPEPNACQGCPAKSVGDGFRCAPCPEGLVRFNDQCACRGIIALNRGIINGSCQECPPGSFGEWQRFDLETDNVCTKCPAGTFREATNEDDIASCIGFASRCITTPPCQDCPANSFTDTDGAVECKPCPPGTFSYGIGETECLVMGAISRLKQLGELLDETLLPSSEEDLSFGLETPEPSMSEHDV